MTVPEVRIRIDFPDGAKHGGVIPISNIPDVDRLLDRVRATILQKLNLVLTIPETEANE